MFKDKENRKKQDKLYSKVAEEIENKNFDKSVWAKAFSDSKGDNKYAESLYIKYRVQKMEDGISDKEEEISIQKKTEKKAEKEIKK